MTEEAVRLQVTMMGAAVYEIGLFKPIGPLAAGEKPEAEMLMRTWDVEIVLKSIPWLRLQNSLGRNVYIRPKGEHHLSLVDDLSWKIVEQMKAAGFHPAIIVQTSLGNFQAWVNHGRVLPAALSTVAARTLAERFSGDVKAAAWRQFGRLAGFTNRKEIHKHPDGLFPFVRLIEATNRIYDMAEEFLSNFAVRLVRTGAKGPPKLDHPGPIPAHGRNSQLRTIEDFRKNPTYAGDGNRIDLAYAIFALSHGVSENAVRQAIASRDLSKKGSDLRQRQYIDRTIAKAYAGVCLSR